MKNILRSIPLTALLFLTSCATIMHGTQQTVGISSNPGLANVTINNQYVGKTPITIDLKRNCNHHIRIDLDGYHPYEIVCTNQMSGWVFGNIIFGGIIGLAVDAITGGIYRLTPEQVQANMQMDNMAVSKKEHNSYVAVVMKPDPSWKKVGQLERVAQ